MRLLNTRTQSLEEFVGRNIPRYAILSHTWEDDEVLFRDMSDGSSPSVKAKKGYQKIAWTCRIAVENDLDYAWIDTCCIDKSSSAELTEAINSMFKWYQRAEICYAFLSDLRPLAPLDTALPNCRWFTRGWTLQELIAPREVRFFDQEWNLRGLRSSITDQISAITRIKTSVLRQETSLPSVCVAQKLSWAAGRETTRVEDTAYCLLGVFDVNMPLLYGEEEKAFRRLQHEIIRSAVDLSIFAWRLPPSERREDRALCGVLADSPEVFAECTMMENIPYLTNQDISVTNIGIKTPLKILGTRKPDENGTRSYVLRLDCRDQGIEDTWYGVWLRKCAPNQYLREDPWEITNYNKYYSLGESSPDSYLLTEIRLPRYIRQQQLPPATNVDGGSSNIVNNSYASSRLIAQMRSSVLRIKLPQGMYICDVWDTGRFDIKDQLFISDWQDLGALRVGVQMKECSFDMDVHFLCYVLGWSSCSLNAVQYTILDYRTAHESANRAALSILSSSEPRKSWLVNELIYEKIPRSPAVALKSPDGKESLFVSASLSRRHDSSVCQNDFWELEFSGKVFQYKEVPKIETGEWKRLY